MKLFLLLVLVLSQAGAQSQSGSCPVFGNDDNPPHTSIPSTEGLFLNFNNPSQCRGTVTRWTYCYNLEGDDNDRFGARFLVYRWNMLGVYTPVPNSVYTLLLNYRDVPQFGCQNVTLNRTERFQILPNDIVAACTIQTDGINPLHVTSNHYRYYYNEVHSISAGSCGDEQLSIINSNQLSVSSRRTVLLHATISSDALCRAGHNPRESSYISRRGTFINAAFRAECDGVVTAWNYCYYPSGATNQGRIYTAHVGLWRYNSTSNQFIVVEGSVSRIELQPVPTPADMYCLQESLDEGEQTEIREGDYVGVLLPSSREIPMIGRVSEYYIERDYRARSSPENISITDLYRQQLAIHLYADIRSETTTTISSAVGTRMEPTTTAGISFAFSPEDSVSPDPPQAARPSGLSSVGMAGVLISVIGLLLILGAAFVVAIICRRNYTRKNLVMSPQVGSTSVPLPGDISSATGDENSVEYEEIDNVHKYQNPIPRNYNDVELACNVAYHSNNISTEENLSYGVAVRRK